MSVDYSEAALAAARRYCGWIVTPPETVTVTVDGSGGRVLSVKSLNIINVTSVVEDGVALDLADLRISQGTGQVWKKFGCWTNTPAGVQITMSHGFDEAPDFDAAVEHAAKSLEVAANRDDPALISTKVDDVEYQWAAAILQSSPLNEALLSRYRILPSP